LVKALERASTPLERNLPLVLGMTGSFDLASSFHRIFVTIRATEWRPVHRACVGPRRGVGLMEPAPMHRVVHIRIDPIQN
jgi:hypothetical protein